MATGDRLPNGSYVMMCASTAGAATPLCLDVAGGTDAIGTEIRLFGMDSRDSQVVTVFDGGDGGDQKLFWPACGRAADVAGGAMADGTDVRLWDSWAYSDTANNAAQTWRIVQAGGTATYAGRAYPLYKVLCHKDNAYCIETYGISPTSGDNVDIWHYDTADAPGKHWIFVPVPTVTTGVYTIRPLADATLCLGVSGGSTAELANCSIEKAVPDASSQVYGVRTDGQGNVRIQSAVAAGYFLGVWPTGDDKDPYDGAGVRHTYDQNPDHNRVNWATQPSGSGRDANGNVVPAFKVVPQAAAHVGYNLDAADGKDGELAQFATVRKTSWLQAQSWLFWPAEQYDPTLGTPSRVMAYDGSERSDRFFSRAAVTLRPAWSYRGAFRDGFSVRYRTRSRRAGGPMGAWSAWAWDANGSTGNGGWGMPGRPSLDSPSDADPMGALTGRHPLSVTVARTGSDRVDVEFEVRAFAASTGHLAGPAHGPSATGTVTVAWRPTLRVTGVAMSPTGLSVMYQSDHTRGGSLVRAEVVGLGSVRSASAPASGSVEVPLSALSRAPREGELVRVRLWMWTSDGAAAASDGSYALSYTAGHGATLSPRVTVYGAPEPAVPGVSVAELANMTVAQAAGRTVRQLAGTRAAPGYCAIASGYPAGTRFFLVVRRGHGDRMVEVDPARILPPLGVPWQLFATYQSGSSWATWLGSFDAIEARAYLVDAPDGSAGMALDAGEKGKGGPGFVPSYESDVTEHVTTGRERPVVVRGRTVTAKWTLEGYLLGDSLAEKRAQADWAAHAGLVTFRSPLGYWAQAYVTNVKVDLGNPRAHAISLSMTEVEV